MKKLFLLLSLFVSLSLCAAVRPPDLGDVTARSIAVSGIVTAENLSGTNTGDETAATIAAALGYTPMPNTSAAIAAALGFTPMPDTSAAIVAALGYTPASSALTINGHALTGNITVTASDVGLGNVDNIKNNWTAVAAPGVNDDSTAGYSVGSIWVDTVAKLAYTCVDAAEGAAVWSAGGGTGGGDLPAAEDVDSLQYGLPLAVMEDPNGIDAYASLALHFDDDFTDSSLNGMTPTVIGNATTTDTNKKFGAKAGRFAQDGSAVSFTDASKFNFGTGLFTIDFWFYDFGSSAGFPAIISTNYGGFAGVFAIEHISSGVVRVMSSSLGTPFMTSSSAVSNTTWHHVVLARTSTTAIKLYVDRALMATATVTAGTEINWGGTNNSILVGKNGWDGAGGYSNCVVDELRISKGIDRTSQVGDKVYEYIQNDIVPPGPYGTGSGVPAYAFSAPGTPDENSLIQFTDSANKKLKHAAASSFPFVINPMTTVGDMIIGGTAGAPARVAAGASGYVWTAQGAGAAPVWSALTKSSVGLGNCDNTSDANKPVSTATQTALNLKADTSALGNAAALNAGTSANNLIQRGTGGYFPPVNAPAGTTAASSLNIAIGVAPTTAAAGDCYVDSNGALQFYTGSDWVNLCAASGVYFTPSVDGSGNLSWTNNGGLGNPSPVNITGPTGATGATGSTGATGATGPHFIPAVNSSTGVISWTNNGSLTNPDPVNLTSAARTTRVYGSTVTLSGAASLTCTDIDLIPATLASGATATVSQSSFTGLSVGQAVILEVVNSGGTLNFTASDSNTYEILATTATGRYWVGFYCSSTGVYRYTGVKEIK